MAATATQKRANALAPNRTKEQWGKKAVHIVACPSGMEVKIRIPNLGLLLEGDALPQTLRNAALTELVDPISAQVTRAAGGGEKPAIGIEEVKDLYDLHKWLVVQTVIEPELELDDLPDLPQEDLEMLTQIATRERTTDALGRSLGVEPLSRYETFRTEHKCATGCEACEKVVGVFSTVEQ